MKNLIQRIITGTIYVSCVFIGLLIHPFVFFGVFLLFMSFTLYEFYDIAKQITQTSFNTFFGIIFSATIFTLFFIDAFSYAHIPLLPILLVLFFGFLSVELYLKDTHFFQKLAYTALGILYITIPFSSVSYIVAKNSFSGELMCGFFIIIWSHDTFSYIWGVNIGKHPLVPKISPKKTIEGFIGGFLSTILIVILITRFFSYGLSPTQWIVAAIIIVVFATIGDVFESLLKRQANKKDSSHLLPGHGGFLDRFDSAIFSIPAFFAYLHVISVL